MELEFGQWLKKRRRALDVTQDDLAERAFCSVNSIRKIEAGALVPSKTLALEIARALAVPAAAQEDFVRFARTRDATAPEDGFGERGDAKGTEARRDAPWAQPVIRFHVPVPLTTVLGREHDTGVVTRILRLPTTRIVTLTGPPGTGKTRLGLEVANELQGVFENGAAFVALAPITRAGLVESAIAQVLNVPESADVSLSAALRGFLRDKELLLVLDNFEHLLSSSPQFTVSLPKEPGATSLVSDLLQGAPRVKILVTSREPLRVYGEREMPVMPLDVPSLTPLPLRQELETYAGIQLFVERAQAVKTDFELTDANAEAIARLCVGLDGLPLALEMAAARVKWETPQSLIGQWQQRMMQLEIRSRDRDARQQTLRGAINWSYDRLSETEQRVLRHFGVFRGSFTEEAAGVVCAFPLSDVTENLVEKSLVKLERRAEGGTRYGLLEMIREYALERLAGEGELDAARMRHAAYYCELGHALWRERALGEQDQRRVEVRDVAIHGDRTLHQDRAILRDRDNFRAAVDWLSANDVNAAVELVADLHDFWSDMLLVQEARALLDSLLPQAGGLPGYAHGLNAAALLAVIQGDHDEGVALAQEARVVAEREGLELELGISLQTLGRIAIYRAEYERAEAFLLAARQQFQQVGQRAQEAYVLNNLGLIAKDRGELDAAEAHHQHALALRRELGLDDDVAQSLLNLCIVAYWKGEYERAIEIGYESRDAFRNKGDGLGVSYALETIGMAQFKEGRFDEAAKTLQESAEFVREVGDKRGMSMVLNSQGDVARAQGDFELAIRCYHEALHLCLQTGERRRASFCLDSLATVLTRLGKNMEAAVLLGAAEKQRQVIGAPLYAAERAEYDALTSNVRSQLGTEEFENAWERGQGMELQEVVKFALNV